MQSKIALCHGEAKLTVQLSCVGDNDMSLGSRVAESKVGRVCKPSNQMVYYVIAKLHWSGIQLQTQQCRLLHFINVICMSKVVTYFLFFNAAVSVTNRRVNFTSANLWAFILKSWHFTAAYKPVFLLTVSFFFFFITGPGKKLFHIHGLY